MQKIFQFFLFFQKNLVPLTKKVNMQKTTAPQNSVTIHQYLGNLIAFEEVNGQIMVNATSMAKAFKKKPETILKAKSWKDFQEEMFYVVIDEYFKKLSPKEQDKFLIASLSQLPDYQALRSVALNGVTLSKSETQNWITFFKTQKDEKTTGPSNDSDKWKLLFKYNENENLITLPFGDTYFKKVQAGIPTKQGTWLHQSLAIEFSRHLDLKFSIWVNKVIEELLRDGQVTLKTVPINRKNSTHDWNKMSEEIDKDQSLMLSTLSNRDAQVSLTKAAFDKIEVLAPSKDLVTPWIIQYSVKSCKLITGLTPTEIKQKYNPAFKGGAKELCRQHLPTDASLLSLNDYMFAVHGFKLEETKPLADAARPVFDLLTQMLQDKKGGQPLL